MKSDPHAYTSEPTGTDSPPAPVTAFLLADSKQESAGTGSGSESGWRRRWQIPVFVAGLVAAAITLWWQPWRTGRGLADWQTLTAQALAAEEAGDYPTARQLAERVLASSATSRQQALAALVLAGCLLAEVDALSSDGSEVAMATNVPSPSQVPPELLQQIESALELAERLGLPRDWQPRWYYRKLWCQVLRGEAPADWPQRIYQLLDESPADRPLGYERLVRYYLRRLAEQPQRRPQEIQADWQFALEASERLLLQPEIRELQGARLRHAQLLMRLQRYSEAREVLARIPVHDPRYPEALHLLAKSWFEENRHEEAAQTWNRLLQLVPDSWPTLPQVLFWLGVCYADSLNQPAEAERVWQRLLDTQPGASAERQAAQLRLALLRQQNGQDSEALRLAQSALQGSILANPYVRVEQLENWLQQMWRGWMETQRYDLARELARSWQAVVGKKASANRALAWSVWHWAERYWQRQQEGEELTGEEQSAMLSAFREAGQIFEETARISEDSTTDSGYAAYPVLFLRGEGGESAGSVPERIRLLYQAALCFQRGQDYPRAIRLLEQALSELDKLAPGKTSGWPSLDQDALRQEMLVTLGECWQQLKLAQKAVEALHKSLVLQGPHRIRGYYQLALALMDLGKLDEAENALREILAVPVSANEPLEYRKALSALGHLHYRREQYETAAEYLDKAISRYRPDSPQSFSLRYWLGECYRLAGKQEDRKAIAADTETRRQFHRQQKRKYLSRAVEVFEALAQSLLAREKKQTLSGELAVLLRESRFALADCYFHLGEYEKAAAVYETLGREYDRQLAGLRAWFEARRAHLAAQRFDEALRAVAQAQRVLEQLRDDDLAPTRMTRQQWQQYLEEARQNTRLPETKP